MKITRFIFLIILCFLPLTVGFASGGQVILCPSSVDVPANLADGVRAALADDPPAKTNSFAITHFDVQADTYLVSVVAIPDSLECANWSWPDDSMWDGLVAVRDVTRNGRGLSTAPNAKSISSQFIGGVQGREGFNELVRDTDLPNQAKDKLTEPLRIKSKKNGGFPGFINGMMYRFFNADHLMAPAYRGGSNDFWFPWEMGKKMYMGSGGIHGSETWPAVDFFSGDEYGGDAAPPYVYGVTDGIISWLCEDANNVGFTVASSGDGGDLLYIHLALGNSDLYTGASIARGGYVGELVYGSFSDPGVCGTGSGFYASQLEHHYHLHLGFQPSGGKFIIEDWVLDTSTTEWTRGNDVVTIGGWLTAEWNGTGSPILPTPIPTPRPGGPGSGVDPNPGDGDPSDDYTGEFFFDNIVGGIMNLVDAAKERYPRSEEEIGIATTTARGIAVGARIMFIMIRSNFNLTVTMIVISATVLLEVLFILYSLYLLIKVAIPIVG